MTNWQHPEPPWSVDVERWADFIATVVERILAIREREGFNGRQFRWQAFERPLPATLPPPRPIRFNLTPGRPGARQGAAGRFLRSSP